MENEELLDEETVLEDEQTDLKEELDSEEEETLPPEETSGGEKVLNVGNIFAVIFIVIAVIILILMIATSCKKKKKIENPELDKSGSKTEVDFKIKEKPQISDVEDLFEESVEKDSKSKDDDINVDEVLNNLPLELQMNNPQPPAGQAPISPVGGTNSKSSNYVSDRPDTRNSKSTRKIEGIKGQDYSSQNSNSNLIANALSGNYGYGQNTGNVGIQYSSQAPNKEDYIAKQMEAIQKMQSSYYNNQNSQAGTPTYYQTNRENFFSNQANTSGTGNYLPYNSIWDGTVISGALITEINTDNPGIVIARVTENVWSSYDQSLLLIPEGSLLYATYNSSVSYGQNRVQVAWNLLIRPDGYRIQLGNMNGVDAQGASGYKGFVNNHPFEMLKALGLVAVFSIIQTEITADINSTNNEYIQNSMSDVYAEASKLGDKIIDKALDIKPTIKIKQGTEIKLITNTPLELPPVELPEVTNKYVRSK